MKIALVLPGGVGPPENPRVIPCLQALIGRLAAQGNEVHVFTLYLGPPGRWPLLGATVHGDGRRPRGARTLRLIAAEHRRGGFDLVHAFCYWPRNGAVGALAAQMLGVPFVLSLTGGEVVSHPELAFGGQRTWLDRMALRLATRTARVVTTQSGFMRDLAAAQGIAAKTVTLGVDLRTWPVRAPRPRVPGEPVRLLHIGGMTPLKDQATLLQAMAMLKEASEPVELEAVGEGYLAAQVRRLAADLDLGSMVTFRGLMCQPELRPSFERADLLVVSSVHESGPLVALEAAAAGVPTVGTRVGHLADWSPQAALAVPVRDPSALAAAIRELAHDEPRRLALAAAAQMIALSEDADYTAERMRAIYCEVLSA